MNFFLKKIFGCILILLAFNACHFEEGKGELCFIGDSITFLWDLEDYFPNYFIRKHAVSGASVRDIDDWDISDCRGVKTILLIGTNDIGEHEITEKNIDSIRQSFIKIYMQRVEMIDATPLIVVSILPRNSWGDQDSTVNMNLLQVNRLISTALDSANVNSIFLDVFDLFLDKNFKIHEYLFKDGLHPNDAGYEILTREIQRKL